MKILLYFLLAITAAASPLHPIPTVTVKGLAGLKMQETGDREWINNFGGGSPTGQFSAPGELISATLSGSTIHQTYSWGSCQVTIAVEPDQSLDISGSATNTTDSDLASLDLNLCKIALPTFSKDGSPTFKCWLDPGYWSCDGSNADIPCWFAYSDRGGWPGTMNVGQENWGNNALYARGYKLKAHETVHFHFDCNFFTTPEELSAVQTAANQAFAAKYPHIHFTDDLRSVGQIFFVTGEGSSGWAANHEKWAKNPRGWLGDPTLDISNKANFKSRMEAFARQCVANADTIPGMRGFVVWDIEGQQYPHGSSVYAGHPSHMHDMAPEMDEIANDLMAILEDGGKYQIGFCLRQQQFFGPTDNYEMSFYLASWPNGSDSPEATADLKHEIDWTQARFGKDKSKIYYVDSNSGDEYRTYDQLSAEYPDVLIFPESFYVVTRMYSSEPQYQTGRPQDYVRNGQMTQHKFLAVYPNAQSVINLADVANNEENVQKTTDSMLHGDIQMVRIWWTGGPEYPLLKSSTANAQTHGWPHHLKPKPTPTPTASPTPTPLPSPTPTVTPSPTPPPNPSPTPTPSPTPSPSISPSPSPSQSYSHWLDSLADWIRQHPAVPDK